eukprot:CAMPEP_0119376678 /NCGR_PEP_ID=MMETSP1334-20130426/40718_1 /TAXON_ID=127549 /ORGANISM="Calcidiscus leptoporus, Strain RCC1130" /LENGTH=54 /DNA_ID=CAMNT_0007395309 /DNA_START=87 /DNA_END=248 /DNA_ORIENTATION=-
MLDAAAAAAGASDVRRNEARSAGLMCDKIFCPGRPVGMASWLFVVARASKSYMR